MKKSLASIFTSNRRVLFVLGIMLSFTVVAALTDRTGARNNNVADPATCVQPPAGLVSWYRAEGNFADSQDGNGGIPSGGVTFASGKVGQAFNMDGVNDIISFGNPENLQLTTGVTAEAWIRPDTQFGNFRTVVSKWSQSANNSWGLFVVAAQDGSANRIYGIVGNANNQFTDAIGGSIPTGPATPFTHVAMTYSAADGIKVYIDGVLIDSDVSVGNMRNGSDIVRIGNDRDTLPQRFFDGLVDEVDIFNRALSAEEIRSIFMAGSDGKCGGPPPSPTPTPSSAYRLTPPNRNVGTDSKAYTVTLETGAGCDWSLITAVDDGPIPTGTPEPPWIRSTVAGGTGPREIPYTVEENFSQNKRTGKVSVLGTNLMFVTHSVSQDAAEACPLECLLLDPPCIPVGRDPEPAADSVEPFHHFRDDILGTSARGKKYTADYYQFAGEVTRLMIFNPHLFLRSKDVVQRYRPVLEGVLKRERAKERQDMAVAETVTVYDSEMDDVDQILASFAAGASDQLRQTLERLRRDIRDPQVQAEFGVRIERGEKRPLPAKARSILGMIGDLSLFHLTGLESIKTFSSAAPTAKMPEIETARTDFPPPSGDVYGKIPLSFEANKGQVDGRVKYLSRGAGYNLFLTQTEAVLSLPARRERKDEFDLPDLIARISNPTAETSSVPVSTLRMKLDGANTKPRVSGEDKLSAKSNYFVGSNKAGWRTDIPNYSRVEYDEVYNGIDLVYYGNQRQLEYDFKVAPGADPNLISLSFTGADDVRLEPNGDLVLGTKAGDVRMLAPITYQDVDGARHDIESRYKLIKTDDSPVRDSRSPLGRQTVGFELGDYDKSRPLVIDPVLAYSTYLGGSGEDFANSITVDAAGNAYLIGFTDSTNFPVSGAIQPAYGGNPQDVFVSKINAAGSGLVYSTYLGGSSQDNGSDIAVDAAGNAYITGYTASTNFPTVNAVQPTRVGLFNAFVAKLNPTGSQLVYSTYFGGTIGEYGSSIVVDPSGSVYVGGVTSSANFPDTPNAFQPNYGGDLADAFIAKLNAAGSQVEYATFLGGNGNDGITGLAIDPAGNAYVTGVTFSTNFPLANPLQNQFRGGAFDAFVTKINPTGTSLAYSTYVGGTGEDRGFRIALDGPGNIYLAGMTLSTDFPVMGALQPTLGGGSDAFVTKLNPAGAIANSTYLGGSGLDGATGLDVTTAGAVYLTGFTTSTNFPLLSGLQSTYGGGEFDAFAAKLNPASSLEYSTYLGGGGYDTGFDIETDSAGSAYLVGRTGSANFPVRNPLQPTNSGGTFDLFITRITDSAGVGGLEGDLASRPTGDGLYLPNDLALVKLFFAGEPFDPTSNEFQRADCAPYATRGDGNLNATDIQQIRNFIAVLSDPQAAGGPAAPPASASLFSTYASRSDDKSARNMRVVSVKAMPDKVTFAVEMDTHGDEVAVSFSLAFDPAHLTNPVVEMTGGASDGADLTVNTKTTNVGRLGVLIDSEREFKPSKAGRIVTITFDRAAGGALGPVTIAFDNWPVGMGLSNRDARPLSLRY